MNRRITIRSAARADMKSSYRWYQKIDQELAEDFLARVQIAVDQLEASPESAAILGYGVRRMAVCRFPYGVFYVVLEDRIVIIGVIHNHRHPSAWQHRTEN